MVEVFKTNVTEQAQANLIIDELHRCFTNYKANFDLEDCDKILRVKSFQGFIDAPFIIDLLDDFGYKAEVLPDEVAVMAR